MFTILLIASAENFRLTVISASVLLLQMSRFVLYSFASVIALCGRVLVLSINHEVNFETYFC